MVSGANEETAALPESVKGASNDYIHTSIFVQKLNSFE